MDLHLAKEMMMRMMVILVLITPSPKLIHYSSYPSAPNAPSKTPSTKGTSSSSIDYTPKSPTSSTSPSTNSYLNSPTSPPPRVPPPPPTHENASMDITLTLSPITPLDVQFNTPSPSPPIFDHPIPWNLLEAHGDSQGWSFADVLKKMANFMPGAQDRLAEASPLLLKLIMPFSTSQCPRFDGSRVVLLSSPQESTVTPASKSLELSTNVNFSASAVASEYNEDMVNAEVDGSNPKMTDDTATVRGSECVSSGLTDVVVALFVGEKGDGSLPSSAADEEATTNSSGV
ncbi:hypothetical protein Tco_0201964 [Tanacetum coccineum]